MESSKAMYQALWSSAALERYRPLLSQREPVVMRGACEQIDRDKPSWPVMRSSGCNRLQCRQIRRNAVLG